MLHHSNFYCNTDELSNLTISGSYIYSDCKLIYKLINFPLLDNIIEPHLIKNNTSIETYIKTNTNLNKPLNYNKKDLENICKYFKYNFIEKYNYNNQKIKIIKLINQNLIDHVKNNKIDILNKDFINIGCLCLNLKKKKFTYSEFDTTRMMSIILINDINTNLLDINYVNINTNNKINNILNKTHKLNKNTILVINIDNICNINSEKLDIFLKNIKSFFKIFVINKVKLIKNELLENIIKYSNYKKQYYNQNLIDHYLNNNIYSYTDNTLSICNKIEIKLNNLELSYYINNNNNIINRGDLYKYGFNIIGLLKYFGLNIEITQNLVSSEKCSISYDYINKYNQCILECGHVFSSEELIYNVMSNINCPLCRNKIKKLIFTRESLIKMSSKLDYILNKLDSFNNVIVFVHKINYEFFKHLSQKIKLNFLFYIIDDLKLNKGANVYIYEGESYDINILNNSKITNIKNVYFMKNIS